MIYSVYLFLFSIIFHVCNNEQPYSSCLSIKPMKTKSNTCASFEDVCLKKGDTDCMTFLNICQQCPPQNITLLTLIDIFETLKESASMPSLIIIILIGVGAIIFILIVENRFKLCTKCCQHCSRKETQINYRLIDSRQKQRNREIIEELRKQIENFKEEFLKGFIIEKASNSLKNASWNWVQTECLFGNSESITIEFTHDDLVSQLTDRIKTKSKFTDCLLVLIYNDIVLEEGLSVKEYNIVKGSVLKYCNFMRFGNANIAIESSFVKGNSCEIAKATRQTQNKSVILKRYKCSNRNFLIESKALRMEILVFQKLKSHPRFVQLCGLYFDDKFMYVEMERMSKKSFKDYIKSHWHFPEKSIAKWTKQILDGVSHLHKNNIVHRNLRSSSILLDENEDIKINAFDFSKYWMSGGDDKLIDEIVKGKKLSYRYASPDFLSGDPPIFADDVWSIGAILVELVTGLQPYDNLKDKAAAQEISECRKIVYDTPKQGISDNLRNFMDSCLQGNLEERATVTKLIEHKFIKTHV